MKMLVSSVFSEDPLFSGFVLTRQKGKQVPEGSSIRTQTPIHVQFSSCPKDLPKSPPLDT